MTLKTKQTLVLFCNNVSLI